VARYVGRENVRKRLEPLAGLPGRTTYADGAARIETGNETITARPPFGLAHARVYERVELGPLFEALAADHVVAALLVRLGGYAVGVFEGEAIMVLRRAPFGGPLHVRTSSGGEFALDRRIALAIEVVAAHEESAEAAE